MLSEMNMKKVVFTLFALMLLCTFVACAPDDKNNGGGGGKTGKAKYGVVGVTPMPDAIDLGIKVNGKTIKWASFNLGASKPEERGDYYAWGETEPRSNYDYESWDTYKFYVSGKTWEDVILSKYNTEYSNCSFGAIDNKTILDPEDDAAHKKLGGKWRIPTESEWKALLAQSRVDWIIQNGIGGYKVTTANGHSIFLFACDYLDDTDYQEGCYWSSSMEPVFPEAALSFLAAAGGDGVVRWEEYRRCGLLVRPVSE